MAMPKVGSPTDIPEPVPSVDELCISFWRHAKQHYGKSTLEVHCYRLAIKLLRELYGRIPAKDFGPLGLKAVQAKLVGRGNITVMVGRPRQTFKHAVEKRWWTQPCRRSCKQPPRYWPAVPRHAITPSAVLRPCQHRSRSSACATAGSRSDRHAIAHRRLGQIYVGHILQTDRKSAMLLVNAKREFKVEQRYLNLPIKKGAPKRKVTTLVDRKVDVTNNIALANDHSDW